MKVKAICIKAYYDEEDQDRFEDGLINEDQIKFYNVGDEDFVNDELYDSDYWEIENQESIKTDHELLRKLCAFQYWIATNYTTLPTDSTEMTKRARLYVKSQKQ